ncbi:MAG: ornithine cyclodeaminase family protein [Deltaproteobacteria bacterium]|nr:ornithine cyclodeaminase family protein [Deltaproteobacteria bacterium]
MTLILSNEEVERLLEVRDCIDVLEDAYREQAAGRAISQLRMDTEVPIGQGNHVKEFEFKTMVGILPKRGIAALRCSATIQQWLREFGSLRTDYVRGPGGRLVGLVQLFSFETCEPLAIFPDSYLQKVRVAATSAIGAKYLARSDSRCMGLLGSGWQASAHVEALCAVRPLELIKVYSPNSAHRSEFAETMSKRTGISIVAVDSPAEVFDADIVIAATNAKEPVIYGKYLKRGTHFCSIGPYEVDGEAIEKADVVVMHSRERYRTHVAGEGQFGTLVHGNPYVPSEYDWEHHILSRLDVNEVPLLEDILTGRSRARTDESQISFFMNVQGLGLQFAAVGARVYELAMQTGVGKEIPTEWLTQTTNT